ncbi:MAG: hypothetical protein L6R41_001089 [Letrouitia leprolyta]|nr:MAG: hypothetical protein L6R41_001089 [Letrouitia leprolyta]
MAAPATIRDIPILITSPAATSERRVSPLWTISHLKAKLEPITGISPSQQRLTLRLPDQLDGTAISAKDEDRTEIGAWSFSAYAELHVTSTDPASSTAIPPLSSVPKYEMPVETYSTLPDTVLAYKKTHQIGRFDPHASDSKEKKVADLWKEIEIGKIVVGARCILRPSTTRRGSVAYIGPIHEIPGNGPWVGVKLDEPVGKNDGTAGGKRYFHCEAQYGVFVRPEKIQVGDWKELGLEDDDDEEEEELDEI